jgi:hypothetical protein
MTLPDDLKATAINIKKLFASLEQQNATIEALKKADIIFGHDPTTDHAFIVYGRSLLQYAVRNQETLNVPILVIDLLQSTSELEMLLAAVEVAHGYHDYLTYEDERQIEELEALYKRDE